MSAFETVLAEIFDQGAERRLDRETERATIALAQTGDEDATLALLYAYAPVLRNLVARHAARIGREEAQMTAVSGLLAAVHAFDLANFDGQLAGIIYGHVSEALREVSSTAMPIDSRTLRRYLRILKDADGNFHQALNLTHKYEMTRSTFLAVHEALRANPLGDMHSDDNSLARADWHASPIWAPAASDAFTDADDAALLTLAWRAVDAPQTDVLRHAYGFESFGDPMSDQEIVHALSVRDLGEEAVAEGQVVVSRATVQRQRSKGLDAMREAVGA